MKPSHLIFAIYGWNLMQKSIDLVPTNAKQYLYHCLILKKKKTLFAKAITGVQTSTFFLTIKFIICQNQQNHDFSLARYSRKTESQVCAQNETSVTLGFRTCKNM